MILAHMTRVGEDDLICDLAETYHVYDWRALPLKTAATLAAGLGSESRIMMRISGQKIKSSVIMQAAIVDRLSLLCWAQTKDAAKGRNRPKMILDTLLSERAEKKTEKPKNYVSGEAFLAAWNGGG